MEDGGDPVCWIDRVCPECGRFQDDREAAVCQSCGAPRDMGTAIPDLELPRRQPVAGDPPGRPIR